MLVKSTCLTPSPGADGCGVETGVVDERLAAETCGHWLTPSGLVPESTLIEFSLRFGDQGITSSIFAKFAHWIVNRRALLAVIFHGAVTSESTSSGGIILVFGRQVAGVQPPHWQPACTLPCWADHGLRECWASSTQDPRSGSAPSRSR